MRYFKLPAKRSNLVSQCPARAGLVLIKKRVLAQGGSSAHSKAFMGLASSSEAVLRLSLPAITLSKPESPGGEDLPACPQRPREPSLFELLAIGKPRKQSGLFHQLVVGTLLNDPALINDVNPIRVP